MGPNTEMKQYQEHLWDFPVSQQFDARMKKIELSSDSPQISPKFLNMSLMVDILNAVVV